MSITKAMKEEAGRLAQEMCDEIDGTLRTSAAPPEATEPSDAEQAERVHVLEETGWLIEHSGEIPGIAETGSINWIRIGHDSKGIGELDFGFTPDANKALRFARKEDAEGGTRSS